jgi:hypothetical protein
LNFFCYDCLQLLGQCDKERRVHVRVDISTEDKASLNALLRTVRIWSDYHYLRDASEFSLNVTQVLNLTHLRSLPYSINLSFFVAELYFACYHWLGLVKRPNVEDEKAWCKWLQQNLNGADKDPSAGQYSIEVIVGWSRRRILIIVVIPFILFLTCTTTFTLLWSFHLEPITAMSLQDLVLLHTLQGLQEVSSIEPFKSLSDAQYSC